MEGEKTDPLQGLKTIAHLEPTRRKMRVIDMKNWRVNIWRAIPTNGKGQADDNVRIPRATSLGKCIINFVLCKIQKAVV